MLKCKATRKDGKEDIIYVFWHTEDMFGYRPWPEDGGYMYIGWFSNYENVEEIE